MKKNKKSEPAKGKTKLKKKIGKPTKPQARRKTAEKQLIESKLEYTSILRSLPYVVLVIDKDGKYISISDNTPSKLLYKPKKELIGKYLHEVFPKDKAEFFFAAVKKALNSSKPVYADYELDISGKTHYFTGIFSSINKNKVLILADDVTERRHTEEKINQTLSLLNATLESTADGILVVDTNGKVTGLNQRFIKMWNIPRDIIDTKSDEKMLDFVINQLVEPEKFLTQVNWLYEHPDKESYDVLEFKDGRIFERYSIPQKLDHKIVGRVWNFRDVSEKKSSEEALIESEKRFRYLFENSVEGIAIMTSVFEECNEQLCTLFGCPKEEIVGHSPWEFSPEFQSDGRSSKESALEKINLALAGKPQSFYWQHMRKDKSIIDSEISLKSFHLEGKNLIQASIRDITERKRSEKIQNALYKISEAVNNTEEISKLYIQIHEVIKSLMPVNNFYISLYNEEADIISFPYFVDEFDSPPEPRKPGRGLTEYVLRTGKDMIITGEQDLKLREKGEVDLVGEPSAVWVGVVLKHEGKSIGVMAVQDYHNEKAYGEIEKQVLIFVSEQIALAIERKRTSEELINYTKQLHATKDLLEERARELAKLNAQLAESEHALKELNINKDKLFSIIAHDLKSPFQPLIGLSEILVEESKTLSDDERETFLKEIQRTIKNQYKLVENLLDWSRIQTGRMEYVPEKINLSECVDSNVDILNANAVNKNIVISNVVKNTIYVFADLSMLNSIFQNLISNAIKFSNPESIITIFAEVEDGIVKTSVIDTGVGMSDNDMQKIFRIDIQHTTTGTAQEKGTGLGLIICKELVERNGGKIWVEQNKTKGTKFIFTLKKA